MSVGRPHNSALIKLADLPRKIPGPDAKAIKSAQDHNIMPLWRQYAMVATTTPKKPPWNAMPPSHTRMMAAGSAK
jgi:hypothetical protein